MDLPIDPEEIERPKDPKRKRNSMFGFGGKLDLWTLPSSHSDITMPFPFQAFFSGDQNKPSGSSVPRPLPRRPDIAPIETGAHGYHPDDRLVSAAGPSTSPQAQSPWKVVAFSPTASDPSFEDGAPSSQSSHYGQPPPFPIPETVKPPNSVAEEPELDQRFNITGFVKNIQRVQETSSSNISKGTYRHATVSTSFTVDCVC
jgi:hypothetical protein